MAVRVEVPQRIPEAVSRGIERGKVVLDRLRVIPFRGVVVDAPKHANGVNGHVSGSIFEQPLQQIRIVPEAPDPKREKKETLDTVWY